MEIDELEGNKQGEKMQWGNDGEVNTSSYKMNYKNW